jgi:acetyl esterase/lipase
MGVFMKKMNYRRMAGIIAGTLIWLSSFAIAETWHRDVAYGSDPMQKLDLVVPDSMEACPLIIIIHGGGLTGGDKSVPFIIYPVIQKFLSHQIAVVSLNYRLAPNFKFPIQLCDVWKAIAFLNDNQNSYHIRTDRCGIWGHSSGSHLGLLVTMANSDDFPECSIQNELKNNIRAVVSGDTPIDLPVLGLSFYYPFIPSGSEVLAWKASPAYYSYRGTDIPNLLLHAYRDDLIPFSQSVSFACTIFSKVTHQTLMLVDNADHCLGRIDPTRPTEPSETEIDEVILSHFYRYLFPEKLGDANCDGQIDEKDLAVISEYAGGYSMTAQGAPRFKYYASYDLDDNGLIDSADFAIMVKIRNISLLLHGICKEAHGWIIRRKYGEITLESDAAKFPEAEQISIFRRENGSVEKKVAQLTPAMLKNGHYLFLDMHLEIGKTYTYRAEIRDISGNVLAISQEIILQDNGLKSFGKLQRTITSKSRYSDHY